MGNSTTPLQTVQRAFEVLELLERERELGPSAVAESLDVSRTTAHDYLSTLERTGYLMNDDGEYRVGYRLLGLGSRVKYRDPLFVAGRAPLRKLSRDLDELAHIGIEERGEWVLVHHEGDVSTLDMGTYPGLRFPMYAQAAGKAILAHLSEGSVADIIDARGLEPVTDQTITDVTALEQELERVRDAGYALDSEQLVAGIAIAAAPVLVEGAPVGSISIACPAGRLRDDDYVAAVTQRLTEAADEISINIRYSM
jgi:DNA-binding IclR family transcriptional regulator